MQQQSRIRALSAPVSRFSALPLPYQPKGRAMALVAALQRLERLQEEMVAKLISELDALEGDPDFEPSLGFLEPTRAYRGLDQRRPQGSTDDLEHEHDGAEPDVDDEPSLGSTHALSQWFWGFGSRSDREEEHDGREPDVDDEHCLGWSAGEHAHGKTALMVTTDDREWECEDEGAQCEGEGECQYETVCTYLGSGTPDEDQREVSMGGFGWRGSYTRV